MRNVRSAQNKLECEFATALRNTSENFEQNAPDVIGKPDIVFRDRKLAVFVDGDYWHGNQWELRGKRCLEEQFHLSTNAGYWIRKIRTNMKRDARQTSELAKTGWSVLRFWESDLQDHMENGVAQVLESLTSPIEAGPEAKMLGDMTVAEFFAGIGLMRLGLERAGWAVRFANDIDPNKEKMYHAQFPDSDLHFHLEDVHLIDVAVVHQTTLATASFPCNDLSLAGARDGLEGSESSAFWGFTRVLRELGNHRPAMVLLENVPGLLTSHGGEDFKSVLGELNALGYLVDTFMIDAKYFVPQSRLRLFVVGVQSAVVAEANMKTSSLAQESAIRSNALVRFIKHNPQIDWLIRPLPDPPVSTHQLASVIEDTPDSLTDWWPQDRADYLVSQLSPSHRQRLNGMMDQSAWSFATAFRRTRKGASTAELRTDGIAGCLRTPRGGSARQILIKAGFGQYQVRLLSPRECARLMGADDFPIDVSVNQALFGFGDAVCVPVIEWIALNYLNPLVNKLLRRHLQSQ